MNGENTTAPESQGDLGAPQPCDSLQHTDAAPTAAETENADLASAGGLVYALLDAARAVSGEVEARAGDAHMTVAQAGLARHFSHSYPGVPMTELATRSGITTPAITQMLRRMTQRGMVRRSESPTDSRAVLVRLTESGQREFRAISARLMTIDRELGRRAGVSPDDLSLILSRLAHSRLASPPTG